MAGTDEAGLGDYVLRGLHIKDFPRELLEQKRRVNLDEFYRRANLTRGPADGGFAFVVEYDEEPICAFWMYHDVLDQQIVVDTFVVDKPWRSETNTPFFLRIAQGATEQVARMIGVSCITFVTPIHEIMMKHFQDERMEVRQHVVSYDLAQEVLPEE